MAKEPKVKDEGEAPALLPASETVTYTPGPGDPNETTWMGHKFKAHVPHPVRNAALIEKARGNKFFHVGDFDPAKHAYKETVAEPKTAEAYRAWAVNWLRDVENVDALCERWANEAKMRARLGRAHPQPRAGRSRTADRGRRAERGVMVAAIIVLLVIAVLGAVTLYAGWVIASAVAAAHVVSE
jgi:hypothetical protein